MLSYKGGDGRALLKFGVDKCGLWVKNGFNWFGKRSSCNLTGKYSGSKAAENFRRLNQLLRADPASRVLKEK